MPICACFAMCDEGTFWAVAARQNASSRGETTRDEFLSKYDVPSALLKWNDTSFQLHQTLGTRFSSIAARPGAFDANNLHNQTLSNCTTSPNARDCIAYNWPQGNGVRGATSMYAFKDFDGELQWDRVNKRFGETLAYTDESHRRRFNGLPVRDEDLLFHRVRKSENMKIPYFGLARIFRCSVLTFSLCHMFVLTFPARYIFFLYLMRCARQIIYVEPKRSSHAFSIFSRCAA